MTTTYTIAPASDLGAMPEHLARQRITLAEVEAWLDAHEDAGTYTITDDADGLPACGHVLGIAGGAFACECGRRECPDTE